MKLEVDSAANFLSHIVKLSKKDLSEKKLKNFKKNIIKLLRKRYNNYWDPQRPLIGSSFRCIRINERMDPVIGQAGDECGIPSHILHQILSPLTIWVDPREVTYRIRENSSIYILYLHH